HLWIKRTLIDEKIRPAFCKPSERLAFKCRFLNDIYQQSPIAKCEKHFIERHRGFIQGFLNHTPQNEGMREIKRCNLCHFFFSKNPEYRHYTDQPRRQLHSIAEHVFHINHLFFMVYFMVLSHFKFCLLWFGAAPARIYED